MNAVMEIANTGSYVSWKLPKFTNVVMTSNPDDGNYSVSSLDVAQTSRFCTFYVEFDVKEWAKWAEYNNLPETAINFALYSPEIFEIKNNVQIANARSYTTFSRLISGIKDWSVPANLGRLVMYAKGCFNEPKEDNTIGGLFSVFVANGLDKLVSADDMLNQKWETVREKIINNCTKSGIKNTAISSLLCTRLINYMCKCIDDKTVKPAIVEARLLDLVEDKESVFGEDLLFNTLKVMINTYKKNFNKLLLNAKVRTKLLS